MVSLLTAIGAGLVVGQGRRIEAAEEAQEKADAIRAQKLMEFDFTKQLQDSKIQAEMKMKEMELSRKTDKAVPLTDFLQGWGDNTPPTTTGEKLEVGARLQAGDTAGAANVMQGAEKRSRESQGLANQYDKTHDEYMETAIKANLVYPGVPIKAPDSPEAKAEILNNNKALGSGVYNTLRRAAILQEGTVPDPLILRRATDAIVAPLVKMTTPGMKNRVNGESINLNAGQHRFTNENFVPYLSAAEMQQEADKVKGLLEANPPIKQVLEDANPALLKFIDKYATPKEKVNQEGGEVQGTVMPNEVKPKPSLQDIINDTSLTREQKLLKAKEAGLVR